MRPARSWLTIALAGTLLAAAPGAGPLKPSMPRATVPVTAQSRDQIASDIVQSARAKWAAKGLAPELADKLAPDLAVVLRSYLNDDFDSVDRLWTERGAKLGTWAAALADDELESGRYDEADTQRLKAASTEDRLRYVWMHTAERGAKWEKVGTDHVGAGTTILVTAGSTEWPMNGGSGLGSRWQSPADQKAQAAWQESQRAPQAEQGWVHLESGQAAPAKAGTRGWISLQNKAVEGKIPAAFVQFPVKMLKGGTILWRMSFAYDQERAAWYPLDLFYSTPEWGDARPLF